MGGRTNLVAGLDRTRNIGFNMEKMFRLVMKAIQLFGPSGGATASQIANYIQSAHRIPLTTKDLKEGVKDSLKKGIAGGILRRRNVDGKYYVCPRTASINPNRLPITKILRRVVPNAPLPFRQPRRGLPPDFPLPARQPRTPRNPIPEMPKPPKLNRELPQGRKVKERGPLSPMKNCVGHTPLPERRRKYKCSSMQQGPRSVMGRKYRQEKVPTSNRSPLKRGLLRGQSIRSPRAGEMSNKDPNEVGRESKVKARTRPKRISLTRKTANPSNQPGRPTAKSPNKSEKPKKPEQPIAPTTESTNQPASDKNKPKN